MSHLCSDKGPCPHRQSAKDGEDPQQYKGPEECQRDTLCISCATVLPSVTLKFPSLSFVMDFLRACVLFAALFALVKAFTHQDMKDALLQKLGMDEVPRIHKRDVENLVIPAHIRNKYTTMLKMHHSRRRRSLPSLAGILKGIPGNAGRHFLNV